MSITPRHNKIWLLLLANLFLCQGIFPQQGAPKVPSTKPAVGTHWLITYEKKEAKSPDKPSPDKSLSDKPSKTRRKHKDETVEQKPAKTDKSLQSEEYRVTAEAACVTKKYADGSERTLYLIHGIAYQKNATTQTVTALSTSGTDNGEIVFIDHYPGCDWLQARYYVDTEQQGEHRCLHYRKPATSKQASSADPQAYDPFVTFLERETWVDADTGLPVSFRQGKLNGTYQHEPVLEEPIDVPEEVTRAVKRYNGES